MNEYRDETTMKTRQQDITEMLKQKTVELQWADMSDVRPAVVQPKREAKL